MVYQRSNYALPLFATDQDIVGQEWQNALNRAQAQLFGAKTPFAKEFAQSELQKAQTDALLNKLNAEKTQALLPILQAVAQRYGGGYTGSAQYMPNQMAMNAQQMEGQAPEMTQNVSQMQPGMGGNVGNMQQGTDPFLEAIALSLFNVKPHGAIQTAENEIIQPSYFGPAQTLYKGRKPEAIKGAEVYATKEAETKAGHEKTLEDRISTERAKRPLFAEMREAVNTPEFIYGTGPAVSILSNLTNNPAVDKVISTLDSSLGDLVNVASRQFSRLTNNEFNSLKRMKGSTSQKPVVLKTKIDLADALSKYREQVDDLTLQNMQNGMKFVDAEKQAYKDVDYSEVKNIIKADDLAHQIAKSSGKKYEDILLLANKASIESGDSVYDCLKRVTVNKKK